MVPIKIIITAKCTTGEAMFYEAVSDQTISMFITQNYQLANDTATDPTIETICSFFQNGEYKLLQFSLGDNSVSKVYLLYKFILKIVNVPPSVDCMKRYNAYALGDDDPPNTASTNLNNVEILLDATPPNSLVISHFQMKDPLVFSTFSL